MEQHIFKLEKLNDEQLSALLSDYEYNRGLDNYSLESEYINLTKWVFDWKNYFWIIDELMHEMLYYNGNRTVTQFLRKLEKIGLA